MGDWLSGDFGDLGGDFARNLSQAGLLVSPYNPYGVANSYGGTYPTPQQATQPGDPFAWGAPLGFSNPLNAPRIADAVVGEWWLQIGAVVALILLVLFGFTVAKEAAVRKVVN